MASQHDASPGGLAHPADAADAEACAGACPLAAAAALALAACGGDGTTAPEVDTSTGASSGTTTTGTRLGGQRTTSLRSSRPAYDATAGTLTLG